MLIGEYRPSIDVKGRLHFPAKLREALGEPFLLSRGLDRCLSAYSLSEWKLLEDSMKTLPRSKRRSLERFFFSGAAEVVPDKQGRIVIPPSLREYAGIADNVVVTGVSDHVEIWDQAAWEEEVSSLSADTIADMMDELGF